MSKNKKPKEKKSNGAVHTRSGNRDSAVIADTNSAVSKTSGKEEIEDSSWTWTPQREMCLDMMFKGASQRAIALETGVHYNTIGNWIRRPEFMQRLAELGAQQAQQVRLIRIQQTNAFTSRISKLADITLKSAEENPRNSVAAEKAIVWLEQFKSFREEERVNAGENVHRVQMSGVVGHVHGVRQASFRSFLTEAVEKNIIDVEAIEASGDSAGDIIIAIVQAALREGDVLDTITEEDKQLALAEGTPQ